jgi:hypothetical protein
LRVALTDTPACGYDEVNVTVEKVRVHQSASATDDGGGWSEVVLNPVKRVDLLTLTNGVLEELGATSLPAGVYTQVRLVLSSNSATTPMANSVVPTGGVETPLDTPSGQQSGLKINTNVGVASNQVTDIVLDFHVCESVVSAGQSGRYTLKPVLSIRHSCTPSADFAMWMRWRMRACYRSGSCIGSGSPNECEGQGPERVRHQGAGHDLPQIRSIVNWRYSKATVVQPCPKRGHMEKSCSLRTGRTFSRACSWVIWAERSRITLVRWRQPTWIRKRQVRWFEKP